MDLKSSYNTCFAFLIALLMGSGTIHAQSFSVNKETFTLVLTTNDSVRYDLLELTNLAGTDLNMRWIRYYGRSFPSGWEYHIQDPDSNYTDMGVDSADFLLPAVPGPTEDKIILQIFPHGIAGEGSLSLKVLNVDDTLDQVLVNYDLITNPAVGLDRPIMEVNYSIHADLASKIYRLSFREGPKQIECYNTEGRLMRRSILHGNPVEYTFLGEGLSRGIYYLRFPGTEWKPARIFIP